MSSMFHWGITPAGGLQDIPGGTEGKSDKLEEYYQHRKQAKQSGVLFFQLPLTRSALNLRVRACAHKQALQSVGGPQ